VCSPIGWEMRDARREAAAAAASDAHAASVREVGLAVEYKRQAEAQIAHERSLLEVERRELEAARASLLRSLHSGPTSERMEAAAPLQPSQVPRSSLHAPQNAESQPPNPKPQASASAPPPVAARSPYPEASTSQMPPTQMSTSTMSPRQTSTLRMPPTFWSEQDAARASDVGNQMSTPRMSPSEEESRAFEDAALAALVATSGAVPNKRGGTGNETARLAAAEEQTIKAADREQLVRTGTLPWLTRSDAEYLAHKDIEEAPGTFTMEVVPGAIGAIQSISAAGYEVVLLSSAQPWLASLATNTLRTVGLVGPQGAVLERNLMFCSDHHMKVRVAYHLGGFSAAIDDDWEALKDLSTEGLVSSLILFNPDVETYNQFLSDQGQWTTFKQQVKQNVAELALLQYDAALAAKSSTEKPASDAAALEPMGAELKELRLREEEVVPECEHLSSKEPLNITCILEELDARAFNPECESANSVIPWLLAARRLGVPEVDSVLDILTDASAPAQAELTAYKVHKGNLLFGGDTAKFSAASAAGEFPAAAQPSLLPPFFPLDGETPETFYPLDIEAAAELSTGDKAAMAERQAEWRARAPRESERYFGAGFDMRANPALGEEGGRMPQLVDSLEAAGPAMRAGVEVGMQLCYVDGTFVAGLGEDETKEILTSRIAQCLETRMGRALARLSTFRAMSWEVLQRVQLPPEQLAGAGFALQGGPNPQMECQYCKCILPSAAPDLDVWDEHMRIGPNCPMVLAWDNRGEWPDEEDKPEPHFLMQGMLLGFLPKNAPVPTSLLDSPSREDLKGLELFWVRPETTRPSQGKGKVLVDLDRVVLRLRYLQQMEADDATEIFYDHRTGRMMPKAPSALDAFKIEELTDEHGRVLYIDHETKTTSNTSPAPLRPQRLPQGWEEKVDPSGRVFFANSAQKLSQWHFPGTKPGSPRKAPTAEASPR